jgi:glyoxylase-like metal-dependent hydrolase (beta-lactamase superfamily II)
MKIVEDIHLIECPFMSPPWFTSVVAVMNDSVALLDSGTSSSPEGAILPFIRRAGRNIEDISHIVLSHGHFDHCGGAQSIKRISGAEVVIHTADKSLIEDPYLIKRDLLSRFPSLSLDGIVSGDEPPFEPVFADRTVQDGERLELGGHEFEVIGIPGHSAGMICLAEKKLGLYIVSDGVQGRGERRPLVFYQARDYVESLKKLKKERVEYLILGHPFPPFEEAVLRGEKARRHIEDSLFAIEELSFKVLDVLKRRNLSSTLSEVRSEIPTYREISIGCILEQLLAEGKVSKTSKNGDIFWALV